MGTLPHLLRALLQSPGAITAAGLRQGDGEAGSRLRGHRRAARLARLDANLIARIWSKSVGGLASVIGTDTGWGAAACGVRLGETCDNAHRNSWL